MSSSNKQFESYLFRRGGKYPVIGTCISLIHIVFLYFFQRIGLTPMIVYNFICIIGYIFFSSEAYRGNKIKEFFLYCVIEVPLHACLATFYVGWNYRFMLILFGAIACVYYFVLFIDDFKHPILLSTFISIAYSILYVSIRIYTAFFDPVIPEVHTSGIIEIFYLYFNTILTFVCIIFFNILTAVEYSYVKGKLLSENSRLDTFASYDPLTNLLNRRSTETQLNMLFNKHYHDDDVFSIIMCDIDKFKNVNDTYGHDAGDFVLKEVSWIIKDTVRDDDIVGRWGGEEFLILIKDNKTTAASVAERIRFRVEEHTYQYKSYNLKVTITLGVSSYRANADLNSLIKSADMKLYRGKENGRNQVVS